MAKVYTGRDGALQLGGTTLAKVVSFQLSSNLETLETTTLNEHIRVYVPGVVGYSGSATLLYYKEDNGTFNTTNVLNKLYKTGNEGVSNTDTVELTFRWIDGTDNTPPNFIISTLRNTARIISVLFNVETSNKITANLCAMR